MDSQNIDVWTRAAYLLGYEHHRDGREPAVPMRPRCTDCNVIDLMPYLMRLSIRPREANG